MEKLTIEYLAPYLPYGLKMYNPKSGQTVKIIGLSVTEKTGINIIIDLNNSGYSIGTFKPLLKPLSERKKYFDKYISNNWSNFEYYLKCIIYGDLTYSEMEELFADNYDVFGLIGKGLAIDINTLKETA